MSEENIELVRRLYAELASESSTQEFERRLTDEIPAKVDAWLGEISSRW